MHYAVHGHTAAELIIDRANAEKEHMGLTTWENAPNVRLVKAGCSSMAKIIMQRDASWRIWGGIVPNSFSLNLAEDMANASYPYDNGRLG